MSDNPIESIRQETEADSSSQAAPQVTPKVPLLRPKYIQMLGGAMVFAGTFMSVDGIGSILSLLMLMVGALIVLAAFFAPSGPGARGSGVAALLGLVASLLGLWVFGSMRLFGDTVRIDEWVRLLGGLLAFAGGWMKNPGVKPQSAALPLQARLKTWVLALGIILLATLLGCFVPYVIVKIQENSYQKVASLPEKATEILTGDYSSLYLSTVDGNVYFCDIAKQASSCTQIAPEAVPTPPTVFIPCRDLPSPPPAPGKVIGSYEYCMHYEAGLDQRVWIILDDGSVWSWRMGCGMLGCSSAGLWMVLGGIVGFVVGMVIVTRLESRRKNREGQLAETKASAGGVK